MNVEEVKEYNYWVDEQGNLWKRQSYFLRPTVSFVLMRPAGSRPVPLGQETVLNGAIGCPLFAGLSPIKQLGNTEE